MQRKWPRLYAPGGMCLPSHVRRNHFLSRRLDLCEEMPGVRAYAYIVHAQTQSYVFDKESFVAKRDIFDT